MKATYSVRKAIGYTRVSTNGQVKDGESLERQKEKIQSYCQYKGYDLEIISDEGISGFKSTRPGYGQLKEICRKRQADLIVVYDLSRPIFRRLSLCKSGGRHFG